MSLYAAILAFVAGAGVGALACALWRNARESRLRIETEVLRARLKSDEALAAERNQALERARDQLKAAFSELSRESLQSNNTMFLTMARERLAEQQTAAAHTLEQRQTAIESIVAPIREALAKSEAQMQALERSRIDAFATIKSQMEAMASGQSLLSRETRNLVTALRRPDGRGSMGRNDVAPRRRALRHD